MGSNPTTPLTLDVLIVVWGGKTLEADGCWPAETLQRLTTPETPHTTISF